VLALTVTAACRPASDGDGARTESRDTGVRNPAVLVVVHSWTGRTAAVADEISAMLGARLVRFSGSPFAANPAELPEQTVASIGDLGGVRDLYLGFPIWGEAPSPPIGALVGRLKLAGIRVIPFYTFLHYASPEALEALRASLRDRGARV